MKNSIVSNNYDYLLASKKARKRKENFTLFLFLAPTIFFVFAFLAFPLISSAFLSLTEFKYGIDPVPKFVFLQGYSDVLFHDSFFWTAIKNQLIFGSIYFVLTFAVSLILAILLNELLFGGQFFQVVFYMPMIIPLSTVGVIFAWILSSDLGLVNLLLRQVGLGSLAIDWYGDPRTALVCLVFARSWKMMGFTLIILLAGLKGISEELRDAAKIDGAGYFQELFYVVIPNLKPFLLISAIWILINSFKEFDLARVVTNGGPGVSTLTLYLYAWKQAFERQEMGTASVIAFITAFIIVFMSWVLNKLFKPDTAQRG
jgi:multiple sugar transport system permease protein